jgi:cytochrome oxidase Cu insertion factor (SCO1/SenC/PrrC family)
MKVRPLFITVDPDRDTVGQMRYYAQGEGPCPPSC